ncbi:hypothetical protein AS593_06945 [Caulobacter vibrioides]|nr:hypothetical protein AS593_06945 [Caulobacter vibrioides]
MAQGDYIALAWSRAEASAADTARLMRVRTELERSGGWRLEHQQPGLWIFVTLEQTVSLRPCGAGVVLGDIFGPDVEATIPARLPCEAAARSLARTAWGAYVALWPQGDGDLAVFRDPMGGLDGLAWRCEGVAVAASDLPAPLLTHLAPGAAIDWPVVAAALANSVRVSDAIGITGLHAVGPGELVVVASEGLRRSVIWTPAQILRDAGLADAEPGDLVACVDRCVAAWSNLYPRILVELSGGLDSAIVGAALVASPAGEVRGWLNQYTDGWVGDERVYAKAVADRLGVGLETVRRPAMTLDPADFLALADGPRPSLNGADALFDRTLAEAAERCAVDAIFTGQGGDVVFLELSTPLFAADRLARLGPKGLAPRFLAETAAWTQVSTWSVIRQAVLGAAGLAPTGGRPAPAYLTRRDLRRDRRRPAHPYLSDLGGAPPVKRLQIHNLAYIQIVRGRSLRGRGRRLVHPLLSQPLVELCLAVPADVLCAAGRGRDLARRAFSGRLPPEVTERRTKGDMTAFYGRAIGDSLPVLRPFLLDGELVRRGLVDAAALEAMLTPERLVHDGRYGDIFDLLAIEAWTQVWRAKLSAIDAARSR